MKRVNVKITRVNKINWQGWEFTVAVDGEPYASGSGPTYLVVSMAAQGYVLSLSEEAR